MDISLHAPVLVVLEYCTDGMLLENCEMLVSLLANFNRCTMVSAAAIQMRHVGHTYCLLDLMVATLSGVHELWLITL